MQKHGELQAFVRGSFLHKVCFEPAYKISVPIKLLLEKHKTLQIILNIKVESEVVYFAGKTSG